MFKTIVGEMKKEGQRKAKKHSSQEAKQKKEKANPFHGRKLSHPRAL
jgi:hypothetical protein